MGVKDLNKFLRDKKINCFIENYPLSNLKGHRIAIDGNNFLFVYGSSVHREAVYQNTDVNEELDRDEILHKMYLRVLNFLIVFMNNGVTPIMVFDGKAEKEKTAEREKRYEDRQKRQDKINELKVEIDKTPLYLRNVKSLGNLPKELWEQALKYAEMEKELKKLMSTQVSVQRDEIDAIRSLLENLGIPCFTAVNEGEFMCAELAYDGHVAGVFSTDSDCLPLGIPFVFDSVTGTKQGHGGFLKGTVLNAILSELKLSYEEFKDFCIMLGTDFNERIKGYGPAKSFKLIEEYRTIENIIEKTNLDATSLNYIRTRHLLTPKHQEWDTSKLDINFEVFDNHFKSVLELYSITSISDSLQESVEYVKQVRMGLI